MPEWLQKLLFIVVGIILGNYLLEWYKKYLNKDTVMLQNAKVETETGQMKLEIRTNINEIIQRETSKLKEDIEQLNAALIETATDKLQDKNRYIKIISDLEQKLDTQFERTEQISEQFQAEIDLRSKCFEKLNELSKKIDKL